MIAAPQKDIQRNTPNNNNNQMLSSSPTNPNHDHLDYPPLSDHTSPLSLASLASLSPHSHDHRPPVMAIRNIIKRRRRLSMSEQACLQRVFDACPKPSAAIRDRLADRLGMSKRCIQIWFQNRRAKQKRDQADAKQPPLLFKATSGAATLQTTTGVQPSSMSNNSDSQDDDSMAFDESQLELLLSDCQAITNNNSKSYEDYNDWLAPSFVQDDMLPIIDPSILEANIKVLEQQKQQQQQHQFAGGAPADLFELYLTM